MKAGVRNDHRITRCFQISSWRNTLRLTYFNSHGRKWRLSAGSQIFISEKSNFGRFEVNKLNIEKFVSTGWLLQTNKSFLMTKWAL